MRVARQVTGALANAVAVPPAKAADLVVIDGMPEGVPAAALRPEPRLPAPADWPFGEEFPRTCGTGRFAGGALFWTDFLYDDHGATGVPVSVPAGGAPPRGTYVYPAGPAAWSRYWNSTGLAIATASPPTRPRITSSSCSRTSSTIPSPTWAPGCARPTPGHITFAWHPQLTRPDLGIGPQQVWWLSDLTADPKVTATRGAVAEVDAWSYARPDPTRTTRRRRGFVPHFDPTPGLYTEQVWLLGSPPPALPSLTLNLNGVAGLTVDVARAGLASWPKSTIAVATGTPARITLAALPADMTVDLDGAPAGPTVPVPAGRHRITLARTGGERPR